MFTNNKLISSFQMAWLSEQEKLDHKTINPSGKF